MSILVLGATGLLGNAMFRVLSEHGDQPVFGTIRDPAVRQFFIPELGKQLLIVGDFEERGAADGADRFRSAARRGELLRPRKITLARSGEDDLGLRPAASSPGTSVPPGGVRLIQISSDGVFRGTTGGYTEDDLPDANDLYGIAKILGEVDCSGAITLRTSIIGHEIQSKSGLLEWFLSQGEECRCHTKAIFSGFPAVVLAQIVCEVVLPRPNLHGIYHVATRPISKFDLLQLVAHRYGSSTRLVPDDKVAIDRSLCADRFAFATGYVPPEWPVLIDTMHSYKFGLKDS